MNNRHRSILLIIFIALFLPFCNMPPEDSTPIPSTLTPLSPLATPSPLGNFPENPEETKTPTPQIIDTSPPLDSLRGIWVQAYDLTRGQKRGGITLSMSMFT